MKDEHNSPLNKLQPASDQRGAENRGSEQANHQASIQEKSFESTTKVDKKSKEINGPKGLEPTRYGDWEAKGRCFDF